MDHKKIKVFIVDDHSIVRLGIRRLIENESDMEIIGEAGAINEAIDLISKYIPDVVIADIAFEDEMSGIELVKAVKNRFPEIVILIHSMYNESLYAERALKAGAMGYIQKNDAPKKLLTAIRDAMNGDLIISKDMSDKIINKLLNKRADDSISELSDREFEIFQLFGKGFQIKKIAEILNLSQRTIESHRRNIKEKMKFGNNSELIKYAVEWQMHHNRE